MPPSLLGIDHVHVYVADRQAAEKWYTDVLGFKRVAEFDVWATKTGPLTISDPSDKVHLALFERENEPPSTAIAFGATGEGFLAWKTHLERHGIRLRIADHDLAFSLYFNDPDENLHEITTYEHEIVRSAGAL